MSGFGNYLNARSDTGGLGGFPTYDVGAVGDEFRVPIAWYRPPRDALADWKKRKGSNAPPAIRKILAEQIREIKGGIARGEELTSEHHHLVLDYVLNNGRMPSGYPARTGSNGALVARAIATVRAHEGAYAASHKSWLAGAVESIAAPVTALAHTASAIAQGKNVLESLKAGASEAISPVASVAKTLSPALNVAAGLASFVPGIGTVAASALSVAAALGRGASVGDLALAAARGALPGGAIAKIAFDAAVGIAHGESPTGIALAGIRSQIPGGDIGKAAFDAGLAVAYHATPTEAAHAASALPKAAQAAFAKPVLAAAAVRKAPPRLRAAVLRKARASTRPRALSRRGKNWLSHAIAVRARTRLDTQGLNPDGKSYTVEKGDSAWRIAQNLTGDGNHHYQELLAANSPPKTLVRDGVTLASGARNLAGANFKFLKAGEVLKIPSAWIGKFVRATGSPPAPVGGDVLSLPTAVSVPTVAPAPPAPATPSPTVPIPKAASLPTPPPVDTAKGQASGERDDPQAIAQAKSILVAWEHTDGSAAAGLLDYGGTAPDQSPIWGPRDSYELRAFTVWSNAHGTALSLLGDLTQAKLDALVAWAENKATQVATGQGTVSPTGMPAPAPAGGNQVAAGGSNPVDDRPAPRVAEASVISIPETSISGKGENKTVLFGFGLAAMALLGLGIAFDDKKRRAA